MKHVGALCLIAGVVGCAEPISFAVDESEVMGGSAATAGKWPDVAAVMFNGSQGCTGTLIAPTVALTAGHCNDTSLRSVLVGTTSLARPAEGEMLMVKQRFEYPQSQSTYDITVLTLMTASTKTPRPIATGWARFDIKNGAPVAIVGYGAIDRNASTYIDELQEATTTITDFDCTQKPGCVASIAPAAELGAGGMGIDTCPGDSGGPLYTVTEYGSFLAGVTSRAYDDATYPCTDGGIYVRPDKIIDWIEMVAGVPVAKGPTPTAPALTIVKGNGAETQITHNDPKSQQHTYAIKTVPAHGMATVRADGLVKVCAAADFVGADSVTVTVTDTVDPTRALDVKIPITIEDGVPAASCDPNETTPPPGEDPPPDDTEEPGGGCCDTRGRASGSSLLLALCVLGILRRRRH